MASNSTDQAEGFALVVSKLSDDEWKFALDYSSYHKVHVALNNLDTVYKAMVESATRLNAALAGMTSAKDFGGFKTEFYAHEQTIATSNLLNFSALYASYIDVCRRIRKYTKLNEVTSYDRSLVRIIGKNSGEHKFVKDLRNYILHNEIVEPECNIHYDFEQGRSSNLVLDSSQLLRRGSTWWKGPAREFIQRAERIDILATVNCVVKDVARLIELHHKLAKKRLRAEKSAYDKYVYERRRFRHLQNATIDIGAVFKRPTSLVSRLISDNVLELVMNSALSDDDVIVVITMIANRYENLGQEKLDLLRKEVTILLRQRPELPKASAYLDGRKL
ncbi:hypothetical protein [Thalassospira sp. GB04J01]|uniref:hypothetical protein n=1 Tax=Thalassospira sp. GB04J01 TaxID=1485225 RepID=UPI0011AEEF5A|nr:hypothetical protein [Thalassospira sp. GB04J01]